MAPLQVISEPWFFDVLIVSASMPQLEINEIVGVTWVKRPWLPVLLLDVEQAQPGYLVKWRQQGTLIALQHAPGLTELADVLSSVSCRNLRR
jgi:hypothetical protein